MPIDRANTAYDPQDRRRRSDDAPPRPTYHPPLRPPPPKPGVSIGLLLWTLFGAALTITTIITALVMYLRA
jgi:hypothetical protein